MQYRRYRHTACVRSTYFFTFDFEAEGERPEHTADMHNTLRDCALPRTGARTHDVVGCPWDPTISAREYDIVLHNYDIVCACAISCASYDIGYC